MALSRRGVAENAPRVGVPESAAFHDLYPYPRAAERTAGDRAVRQNEQMIIQRRSGRSRRRVSRHCRTGSHLQPGARQEIDYIFLPSVINMEKNGWNDGQLCVRTPSALPYTQAAVDYDAWA